MQVDAPLNLSYVSLHDNYLHNDIVTGKINDIAAFEENITLPVQSEAQSNCPDLDTAHPLVHDVSPGFSNLNPVKEQGIFSCILYAYTSLDL